MCIVCEVGFDLGEDYLVAKQSVNITMKRTEKAILAAKQAAIEKGKQETAERYDALHKKLVKQRRAYNRLDEEREAPNGQIPLSLDQN